jgi:TolB-like protein/Flp pilus assembly protein TadD
MSEPASGANITTSASHRAVFLSYASEDTSAAQAICDALRAAGIEVWFDQSELRGGDAWDLAIRKQIKSCALFMPIISVNAHARTEGYFRLEWKLAVDRSHLLAPDRPFLMPVVIDQTPQTDERLPDRFRELQWTRLPGGRATPEFVERIKRLLSLPSSTSVAARPVAAAADAGASGRGAGPVRWGKIAALIAVAVVAIAGAGSLAVRESGWLRRSATVSSSAAAAREANEGKSVAVLPFADDSENKDQAYFSDGLSDELIDKLAKIPGLHVPARTSSFYFKGRQATLGEIGAALNVSNVLEGSVRKSGSSLRISAELIRIGDETRIWSDTYDRKLDDVFKVQDDIANSVVTALKISMLGERREPSAPTGNSDAYLLYLQGRESLLAGGTDPKAIEDLDQAVSLDPSFAEAWQLIGTWHMNAFVGGGTSSYESARRETLAALQRSLSLAPQDAFSHAELARMYYMMDWDAAAAEPELARALAIDPNNASALWLSGYIDDSAGRFAEALAMHDRVRDINPLFVDNYRQLGNVYYRSGKLTEGVAELRDALNRFPQTITLHYRLALLLLAQNRPEQALEEFRLEQHSDFRVLGVPLALFRLGRREEADRMLDSALEVGTVVNGAAYQVALVYAARGDADKTFQWLDRALRQRDAGMHWMKYDPMLQTWKDDPRFKSLLARMKQS